MFFVPTIIYKRISVVN